MPTTYSVKDASELTGASKNIIRVYTGVYSRWFSTEATPEQGKERRFTAADLKLIRFIYQTISREKATHEQIQARLADGELNSFEWELPQEPPGATREPIGDMGMPLVPMAQLQAAHALLQDAQRREEEAREREQALQERIEQMQREMGKLEGKVEILESQLQQPAPQPVQPQSRSWLARLLGKE